MNLAVLGVGLPVELLAAVNLPPMYCSLIALQVK
jgi:hypothetical protein